MTFEKFVVKFEEVAKRLKVLRAVQYSDVVRMWQELERGERNRMHPVALEAYGIGKEYFKGAEIKKVIGT
jgi:hypothetical protein